jgi:hypothetical protein
MDKRAAKRHERQVARAKEKKRLSEPDVRTPQQIEAAREASRTDKSRGITAKIANAARSFRNSFASSTGSSAKTDG